MTQTKTQAKTPVNGAGPHDDPLMGVKVIGPDDEEVLEIAKKNGYAVPGEKGEQTPGEPIFKIEGLTDLLNRPDKEWLIDRIIGAGDSGMIYGPPGCGKTFGVIDLIFAACLGQRWAMRFDVLRPLTVCYCAGEGIGGLKERFKAAAAYYNVKDYLPGFYFSPLVPQLFQATGMDTMRRFIDEWKASDRPELDLLIIDTMHNATVGADENSAQDMGRALATMKLATTELGCAQFLVHHSNKAGTGERGSSALRGAMDVMIEVTKAADKYGIYCNKLKDGEAWKAQTFDLVAVEGCDSVRVWWDEPMDDEKQQNTGQKAADKGTIAGEMRRYAGTRFTVKSLAEVLGKTENYVRNLVLEMERDGVCERELQDPGKSQSNRNPWVYFIEPDREKG
ncbi:MAG: hypothetical protein DCC55_39805 [Chloroflexi bacterium]|nr:MAG: hypothetical protein DCC55_39805 [Chloroflexota bacterium]